MIFNICLLTRAIAAAGDILESSNSAENKLPGSGWPSRLSALSCGGGAYPDIPFVCVCAAGILVRQRCCQRRYIFAGVYIREVIYSRGYIFVRLYIRGVIYSRVIYSRGCMMACVAHHLLANKRFPVKGNISARFQFQQAYFSIRAE